MKLNNKGFTLIEVLAVIVILSLLAGIAIPSVLSSINTSKEASYDIMISNIVTASSSLYEEIEYNNSILYEFNSSGSTSNEIKIVSSSVSINLQTLVSNGFLNGSNNDCNDAGCTNQNKKVLLDPKSKKDIGDCEIIITKTNTNGKISYEVSNPDPNTNTNPDCPSKYKKEVK